MTVLIILAVVLGAVTGYYIFPVEWYAHTDTVLSIGLCVLLLFVGMDMGKQKGLVKQVKQIGVNILIVPIMIGMGSIVGAMIFGSFIGLEINESGAVGAGFGWYTLSAIMLADYSAELSAIAFLTNVIREVLAIVMIPFIAKYIGYYEAIAPCGATAMDTTLPVITRYTDSKTAVAGFVTGVILSGAVPVIVPIMIGL